MEWLQFLGYRYPTSAVIPYAATIHVMVQPILLIALAIAVSRPNRHASSGAVVRMVYEHPIMKLALLSTAFLLLRLVWGKPTLPCEDVYCSLLDDTVPRCIIDRPHMTWSVPLRTLPTGLYGTIHLATHHHIFLTLAPLVVNRLAPLPILHAVFTMGAFPASWYAASVTGSVWCYTAVIVVSMYPVMDLLITRARAVYRATGERGA
jgi:hypothetical protein